MLGVGRASGDGVVLRHGGWAGVLDHGARWRGEQVQTLLLVRVSYRCGAMLGRRLGTLAHQSTNVCRRLLTRSVGAARIASDLHT